MANTITITHDEQHTKSNKIFATLNGVHKQARKMFITKDGIHKLFYECGVKWNKYNAVANETYRYVQDDTYVGQAKALNVYDPHYFDDSYEFTERYGFNIISGTTKTVPLFESVGAYEVSTTEVWQVTSVATEPDANNRYLVQGVVVGSASKVLDSVAYSKGNTLIGAVYAEEGERPVEGTTKDSGNGWYIISNEEGVYYYERVL